MLHTLDLLMRQYGYGAITLVLILESMGLPLPGEGVLIAAAIYAATTHRLGIVGVVAAAALGAILGYIVGYGIGRLLGHKVLARIGPRVGLNAPRLALGRYLFRRHGGKVVFFGRFVVLLRAFAALLAGANDMDWRAFLGWNIAGGIIWTAFYGFGAYALGNAAKRLSGPVGLSLGGLGAVVLVAVVIFLKRNEARLTEDAMRDAERSSHEL